VPSGIYTIMIGPLEENINVDGDEVPAPKWQRGTWYETFEGMPGISDLEAATGREYVHRHAPKKGSFTMNSSLGEMKDSSFIMKMVHKGACSFAAKHSSGKTDPDDPAYKMAINSSVNAPLRALQILSGQRDGVFRGLLKMANGHFFKGLIRMIKR